MTARLSITQNEDGDFDFAVVDKNGDPQALDDGGVWVTEFSVKLNVDDPGAPLISKSSTVATEILHDADQILNPGKGTIFVLNAESILLAVSPHRFDFVAIEPNGKRRYLITGGVLEVKKYIGVI